MKVLFLKDNLPTAMAGEIKEVKPGFARNFLIPQGIAELANRSSIERIEKLRKQADVRRGEMKSKWQSISNEIKRLLKDKRYLDKILDDGCKKADSIASIKIKKIRDIVGF